MSYFKIVPVQSMSFPLHFPDFKHVLVTVCSSVSLLSVTNSSLQINTQLDPAVMLQEDCFLAPFGVFNAEQVTALIRNINK